MKFQKGNGGRPKGSQNKKTAIMRTAMGEILGNYFNKNQFLDDLNAMEPKDRALVVERFTSYVLPKLQATTIDMAGSADTTIEDRLIALSSAPEQPNTVININTKSE